MKLIPGNKLNVYHGQCLRGFLFGIYSGIFALHLHASKEKTSDNNKQKVTFYALCVLYALSAAPFILGATDVWFDLFTDEIILTWRIEFFVEPVVFACCDLIAQCILIHRCWIVWGRNIRVVIIPAILVFAYLVMWTTALGGEVIGQGAILTTLWSNALSLATTIASMTVNALATGLIVFKIFKVSCQVKDITTSGEKYLAVTGGRKLHSIIFIIIESGMALFAIQLARVVLAAIWLNGNSEIEVPYSLIVPIHEMLNGIAPTLILVRVSMGLSFHDEPSLVEAVSSLRFNAVDDPNPNLGTGSIGWDGSSGIGVDCEPVRGNTMIHHHPPQTPV